ncbi:beta-1,3-galactosyltransferase 5-like isoform X2 [Argopecten irradians]
MLVTRKLGIKCFALTVVIMVTWILFPTSPIDEVTLTHTGLIGFTELSELRTPKSFLIVPKQNVQSVKNVVIIVVSKASNSLQRETIRKTWGNPRSQIEYNFTLYFLLGREEHGHIDNTYNDIIQVDIVEDYYNLTDKTVAAFNWVVQHCHEASYFFKVDDDVYLDLAVLGDIQNNDSYLQDNVIIGSCRQVSSPVRKPGKWQVSYDEYPFTTLPPFCNGPGYAMTIPTARIIYEETRKTKMFKLEDVYVGMVAYRLGISVKHIENFVYDCNTYIYQRLLGNLFSRCHTIIHYASSDVVHTLWDQRGMAQRGEKDCSFLGEIRFYLSEKT